MSIVLSSTDTHGAASPTPAIAAMPIAAAGSVSVGSPGYTLSWGARLRALIGRYGLPRTLWALVVGLPATKLPKLKPTGYNAFVERITQPMLIIASIALTTGAVFVMAEGLIHQASVALSGGHVPAFQTLLALGTLFVIGFLIDTSLITAGSRFRMHALRGESGWAILSCVMLLLCVGVEGMTWSYLLYELEPAVLPINVSAFIRGIPGVLFFVRAYMGPLCLIYLTAGVLPLTIQRNDVDRQTAAVTGSAIVAVINSLVRQIQETGLLSSQHAVKLLDLLLVLFRVSAKHQTEQDDAAMVAAFRDLSDGLAPAAATVAALRETTPDGTSDHLQEVTAALAAQAAHLETFLESLRRLVEQRLQDEHSQDKSEDHLLSQDSSHQPSDQGATITEHAFRSTPGYLSAPEEPSRPISPELRRVSPSTGAVGTAGRAAASTSGKIPLAEGSPLAGGRQPRRAPLAPRPGSRAFSDQVYNTVLGMQRDEPSTPRTFYTIAERIGEMVTPEDVKAAFEQMRQARLDKLRPGGRNSRADRDPVLDDTALITG